MHNALIKVRYVESEVLDSPCKRGGGACSARRGVQIGGPWRLALLLLGEVDGGEVRSLAAQQHIGWDT